MKRVLAKVLAVSLCLVSLTACASMLERDYTVTAPHQEDPPYHAGAAYRVETYTALRSALLSYVEEGMEEGLLRFPTTYPGDLSVDMEKARRQVMEEEPLGCYALKGLAYRTSKIIAYYEVELDFTYKVDPTTLASMHRATSRQALVTLLGNSLSRNEESLCVYLAAYPEGEAGYFEEALLEAWQGLYTSEDGEAADPETIPDPPQLAVELYPETGSRRVALLTFTYPQAEEGDAP